ncbi:hypothetical protein D3C76_682040 [compost metagenome]
MHLLEQVALALARQFREVRRHAVTVGAMAGTTHCGFRLTGLGIASGVRHTGKTQGQQQTHEKFVHQLIQLRLRVKELIVPGYCDIHWMVAW